MKKYKCTQKYRDKHGNIIGYRLVDKQNSIEDYAPEELKQSIRDKRILVSNLKLTSDNRLIDNEDYSDDPLAKAYHDTASGYARLSRAINEEQSYGDMLKERKEAEKQAKLEKESTRSRTARIINSFFDTISDIGNGIKKDAKNSDLGKAVQESTEGYDTKSEKAKAVIGDIFEGLKQGAMDIYKDTFKRK